MKGLYKTTYTHVPYTYVNVHIVYTHNEDTEKHPGCLYMCARGRLYVHQVLNDYSKIIYYLQIIMFYKHEYILISFT